MQKTIVCFLVSFLVTLMGADLGMSAETPFVVRVKDGLLTLKATGIPLRDVLTEIVDQSGIEIVIHGQTTGCQRLLVPRQTVPAGRHRRGAGDSPDAAMATSQQVLRGHAGALDVVHVHVVDPSVLVLAD